MLRAGDLNLLRIHQYLADMLSICEFPCHSRMNLDFARQPRIEAEMHLPRHHLHHDQIPLEANLLRGQIKRAFAGLGISQFKFCVDVSRTQFPDHALGAAHADLRFRYGC